MPPVPWVTLSKVVPEQDYLVLLSYLPLSRYRKIPAFLGYVFAIQRQLAVTQGLLGYSLYARPVRKQFWTLSVWVDGSALSAFVRTKPHRDVMSALNGHMGSTKFIEWHASGSLFPPTWRDAMDRFQKEKSTDARNPA